MSAEHAVEAEVRLYDRLFNAENPMDAAEGGDISRSGEPEIPGGAAELFCGVHGQGRGARARNFNSNDWDISVSTRNRRPRSLVFNRTITLRDTWARMQKKGKRTKTGRRG